MKIILILTFLCSTLFALEPAGLFTDHMVLQRNTLAPIWGTGDAGEEISISGSWGETATCVVKEDGTWMTKLQTPDAGGPHTLTMKGNNQVVLKDVYSGEVWLCTGQSNMQWTLKMLKIPEPEIGNRNLPLLRHFKVKQTPSQNPKSDVSGKWVVSDDKTAMEFSGTAFFFGRHLQEQLNVPIGLINSTWGGTWIESWLSSEAQKNHAPTQEMIAKMDRWAKGYNAEKAKKEFDKAMAKWTEANKGKKNKDWRSRPKLKTHPQKNQRYPGNLYRGMIHPLAPYAIKGNIWYQGEANSKSVETGTFYRTQLKDLISSWRNLWNQGDFPFYVVQLVNFMKPTNEPVGINEFWPYTRESMMKATQEMKNADIAVGIDIGEAKDIHPKNKLGIGTRLAKLALCNDYKVLKHGKSPIYDSHVIIENEFHISFHNTASGLISKGDELKGFAIAGADGVFKHAKARINDGNDKVIVSSPKVLHPKAVRYAWANNPEGCNLYNEEGLPASPFRTDF